MLAVSGACYVYNSCCMITGVAVSNMWVGYFFKLSYFLVVCSTLSLSVCQ